MPVDNKYRDLVVTRVVAGPVGQVWQAWTDPEQVRRWWGPTGFTCPLARMDVREGGTSLVAMRSPQGQDLYNTWTYRSIVPHQRVDAAAAPVHDSDKPTAVIVLGSEGANAADVLAP